MNEKNIYIVRCGEVALKGMNKPYFERVLMERIKKAVKDFPGAHVWRYEGVVFARTDAPERLKEMAQEVADLLRYSDPVSVPGLSEMEGRIQDVMKLWKQAAEDKDRQQFLRRGQKLKDLITERNNQCLALKRAK